MVSDKIKGILLIAGTTVAATWMYGAIQYGTLNPTGIYNADKQKTAIANAAAKKHDELSQKLLGKNGLVDTDKDGKISIAEIEEMYKRIGINAIDFQRRSYAFDGSGGDTAIFAFPPLDTSNLEKAVQSFEAEAAQN